VRMNGKQVTTALLIGTDLYVANAGDSRTILCRRAPAGCMPLSEDHKASVASEAARIKARRGKVMTAAGKRVPIVLHDVRGSKQAGSYFRQRN
jgi:serine/threonine protein phosphatase PrpC